MSGMNKFEEKERRRQRRRNFIVRDLHTPKYHQRVVTERKRVENEDGSHFFADRYYEDEVDW